MSKNKIIKKSNDLVEASYNLSLWEMRILLKMTSMIHFNDKDFKVYEIDVKEIKEFFAVENEGSVYTYIKDSVRSLMDRKITIRTKTKAGKTKETIIPMVISMARIIEEKSSIHVSFHPLMKPYLLDLKSKFLSYDVENVLRLTSSYGIRLYELTRAYVGIGKRTFTIEELKKILGIENKYKQYTHLKKRVLEPSRDNINETTDINLKFEEIKEGRRVAKICFIISQKQNQEDKTDTPKIEAVANKGIAPSLMKTWREKHTEAHILARIKYMNEQIEKGAVIKNETGYLTSIMDKELVTPKVQVDITKKVNAMLFSRPNLQKQIEAKHGTLSQEAMNAVVKKMFPDKF